MPGTQRSLAIQVFGLARDWHWLIEGDFVVLFELRDDFVFVVSHNQTCFLKLLDQLIGALWGVNIKRAYGALNDGW